MIDFLSNMAWVMVAIIAAKQISWDDFVVKFAYISAVVNSKTFTITSCFNDATLFLHCDYDSFESEVLL